VSIILLFPLLTNAIDRPGCRNSRTAIPGRHLYLTGQHGFQPGILMAPPERELQTQVASQRLLRFCQRPIHRKSVRTHPRWQRYRVNCSRFDILKRDPHKLHLSFPPKTPVPSRHTKSFKPPRGRAGSAPRWPAHPLGPLNSFTCAAVRPRFNRRDSRVYGPVIHAPALRHSTWEAGLSLRCRLLPHRKPVFITCARYGVCPHAIQAPNHPEHRPGQSHPVGQVELSQLVIIRAPSPLAQALRNVSYPSAGAVVWPALADGTLPEQPKPTVFKLVRQRDFVARLRPTQKKMEVEPSRHLPKLRAQRNQESGIGPLDQLRRQAHQRPGPAIRDFRGRD
jgi:hypothetical protein